MTTWTTASTSTPTSIVSIHSRWLGKPVDKKKIINVGGRPTLETCYTIHEGIRNPPTTKVKNASHEDDDDVDDRHDTNTNKTMFRDVDIHNHHHNNNDSNEDNSECDEDDDNDSDTITSSSSSSTSSSSLTNETESDTDTDTDETKNKNDRSYRSECDALRRTVHTLKVMNTKREVRSMKTFKLMRQQMDVLEAERRRLYDIQQQLENEIVDLKSKLQQQRQQKQ